MKVHQVKQRSDTWHQLRMGKWTASQAKKILTSTKLEPSSSQDAYIDRIVAELVIGKPLDEGEKSKFMERGSDIEGRAHSSFEVATGMAVEPVGFIETDDGWGGCSPDGLLDGGAMGYEGKAPKPETHVGYRRDPASLVRAYRLQVQSSLWICKPEITVWYLHSFCPDFDDVIEFVEPEEAVQEALDREIPKFVEELKAALDRELGPGWQENPFL